MKTKEDILNEATSTLVQVFNENKKKGLVSIYLWGSIITPDFNPETSDIDAIGFLSDKADFNDLNTMREWLPALNSKLVRLQINFFYLSELTGEKPIRSKLARLSSPAQAIFDFPNWKYICGSKIDRSIFPIVTPRQFLEDQIIVVEERQAWARNPTTPNDLEYYCKSLVWLCVAIEKLDYTQIKPFSWHSLEDEARFNIKPFVKVLDTLKKSDWDKELIRSFLPYLFEYSSKLIRNKDDL